MERNLATVGQAQKKPPMGAAKGWKGARRHTLQRGFGSYSCSSICFSTSSVVFTELAIIRTLVMAAA